MVGTEITDEMVRAADRAAFPGLPAGVGVAEAERRTEAAIVAAKPYLAAQRAARMEQRIGEHFAGILLGLFGKLAWQTAGCTCRGGNPKVEATHAEDVMCPLRDTAEHRQAAFAATAPDECVKPTSGVHRYVSTACLHGQHGECRLTCKFCKALCGCPDCRHPAVES